MGIFENARVEKVSYTLRGSSADEWKSEIIDVFRKKYPFLTRGIKTLNLKQEDEKSQSLIAELVVDYNGEKLIVPIIVSDGELKSPDIAFIDSKEVSVPIDESILCDRIGSKTNVGEIVSKNKVMNNYEYLTQNGLFEGDESYSAKYASGEPIEIVHYEYSPDKDIPYHYNVSFVTKTASGLDVINSYCNASKLNVIKDMFSKKAEETEHKTISSEVRDTPVVKKITSSGRYDGVLLGDKILRADIYAVKPFFGRDKGDSLVVSSDGALIGYGEAYAAVREDCPLPSLNAERLQSNDYVQILKGFCNVSIEDANRNGEQSPRGNFTYFVVSSLSNLSYNDKSPSPLSELFESRGENLYTDPIKNIKIYTIKARSMNDGEERFLVFGYPCSKVTKVSKDVLKSLGYVFMSNEDVSYFMVPQGMAVIGFDSGCSKLVSLGEAKKHFRQLVDKVASALTDRIVYSKDGNGYDVCLDIDGKTNVLRGVSKTAALAVLNYVLGESYTSLDAIPEKETYMFKIAMPTPRKEKDFSAFKALKSDLFKLASYIEEVLPEKIFKLADAGSLVNDLIGEDYDDFRWEDESAEIINQMHKLLTKISELLIMVRIGKVDISESVLSRAMYALTDAIREVKGDSGSNA